MPESDITVVVGGFEALMGRGVTHVLGADPRVEVLASACVLPVAVMTKHQETRSSSAPDASTRSHSHLHVPSLQDGAGSHRGTVRR
jgi:hypothetical protein